MLVVLGLWAIGIFGSAIAHGRAPLQIMAVDFIWPWRVAVWAYRRSKQP